MNRRDFSNSMADTWDTRCRHDPDRINDILDLLPIRTGDAVLDVGSDTGVLIPFLIERIGDKETITAIDMAENMISIAASKPDYGNVPFMAGDVFTADLPSCGFDIILCYSVFPHFDDKENAPKVLAQYLTAGGIIAICRFEGRDAINSMHKSISPAVKHDHLPPARTVARHLVAAGCEIVTLLDTERVFVVAGRKRRSGGNTTGTLTPPRRRGTRARWGFP